MTRPGSGARTTVRSLALGQRRQGRPAGRIFGLGGGELVGGDRAPVLALLVERGLRLDHRRAGARDGRGGGGGLARRHRISALRLHQRQARLDPALDHRPDEVQLLAAGVARRHPGVVGGLGLLDGAAGLGDPRLAGVDHASQLLHPRGVERALDHHLARRRLVGRRRIGRLAPGHFGREPGDLHPERVGRGLAAAELGAGGGPVEPDQLLARLHLLARS